MGTTTAEVLATFISTLRYADIPTRATDYAAMLISSTAASAAMGSTLHSSYVLKSYLAKRGGRPESTVWFSSCHLPAAAAARLNALMSDAAASDDSDLRNITHPGTATVAAALAVAEKTNACGKDILAAIVLGYEAAGRINTGVIPGLIWEKGFHGCMVTIFGATVAAGVLLGLTAQQLTHALGLAATSNAGLLAAANTSTAREHHAGLAAMLGVEAAELAGIGYTAEPGIFDHQKGYFGAYGQDAFSSGRLSEVTARLGETWQILTHMAVKLAPGGHPYHAIAEAASQAAIASALPDSEIASITISHPNPEYIKGPRHPTDLIGIAHSPYYFAAAGAVDRRFGWEHASDSKIMDPAIRRVLDLVQVVDPPKIDLERYRQGATVTLTVRDGRSFSATVFAPNGAAINGIDWNDIDAKFRALARVAKLSDADIQSWIALARNVPSVRHARDLTSLIA